MKMAQNTSTQGASHLFEDGESEIEINEYISRSRVLVRIGEYCTPGSALGGRPNFFQFRQRLLENFFVRHLYYQHSGVGEYRLANFYIALLDRYSGTTSFFVTASPQSLTRDPVLGINHGYGAGEANAVHFTPRSVEPADPYWESISGTDWAPYLEERHHDGTRRYTISLFPAEYLVLRNRETCGICMEDRLLFVSTIYRCVHRFCTMCADRLLSTCHIRCPLCRSEAHLLQYYSPQMVLYDTTHAPTSQLNGNNGSWTNADDHDFDDVANIDMNLWLDEQERLHVEVVNPLHAVIAPVPNVVAEAAEVADGQNLVDILPVVVAEGVPFDNVNVLFAAHQIRQDQGGFDPYLPGHPVEEVAAPAGVRRVGGGGGRGRFLNRGHGRGEPRRNRPREDAAPPAPHARAREEPVNPRQVARQPRAQPRGRANPNVAPPDGRQRRNRARDVQEEVAPVEVPRERPPPRAPIIFNPDEPVPYDVMLQLSPHEIATHTRYTACREARLRHERNQRQAEREAEEAARLALQEQAERERVREERDAGERANAEAARLAENTRIAELEQFHRTLVQQVRIPTKRVWRRWGCWKWLVYYCWIILRNLFIVGTLGLLIWGCVKLARLQVSWSDGVFCSMYIGLMYYVYKNNWWLTFDVETGVGLEWEVVNHFWTEAQDIHANLRTNYEVGAGYRGYFYGPAYVGLLPDLRMEYAGIIKFTAYHDGNLRRFIVERLKSVAQQDADMQIVENTVMVFAHEILVQIKRGDDNIPFSPSTVFGLNWN